MTARTEHFEGSELADDRWVPWYLPHWSSRESSRATYDVASSVLRLRIPTTQGLWCADRHSPALRTSTIASGLYAGPLGSTVGQQPFADGLTVSEEQDAVRGWLVEGGRLTVRARADLTARSMVSVWLVGFEDEPDRCGEVCVFEVFGDTVSPSSAGVGAGVHAFRDPALREDFSVTPVDLDLREWHDYTVTMSADGCAWSVDGQPLRTSRQRPSYPLQIFVGVFDFPDREDGTTRDHEPTFEVDSIVHTVDGTPDHGRPRHPQPAVARPRRDGSVLRRDRLRDDVQRPGWLILERGSLVLEFFHDPGVDPATTSAGSCLRVDDVDGLYADCVAAGLPVTHLGWPRLHPPKVEDSGLRIGALVDADGNLLRLIQNPS